jgi:hypothetical protein
MEMVAHLQRRPLRRLLIPVSESLIRSPLPPDDRHLGQLNFVGCQRRCGPGVICHEVRLVKPGCAALVVDYAVGGAAVDRSDASVAPVGKLDVLDFVGN